MAYSKLHSSLVNSSLWTEPDNVRILFITLLSICDQHGEIQGVKSGLERIANIDPGPDYGGGCDPWSVLMSEDKQSSDRYRNPENEGRRIEEIPGGFRLLNFLYYRSLRNEDDRREQNRRAQAKFRNKPESAIVSQGKPQKAHTEAEANKQKQNVSPNGDTCPSVEEIYDAYPRHEKKPQAVAAIQKALKKFPADFILARTKLYAATRPPRSKYTPLPASWFNAEQFNDDPTEWERDDDKTIKPRKPWDTRPKAKPKFDDLYPT